VRQTSLVVFEPFSVVLAFPSALSMDGQIHLDVWPSTSNWMPV
jgi:hypothetical protein